MASAVVQGADEHPGRQDVTQYVHVEQLVEERRKLVIGDIAQTDVPVEDALRSDERVQASPPPQNSLLARLKVLKAGDIALHEQHLVAEFGLEGHELLLGDFHDRDVRALGHEMACDPEPETRAAAQNQDYISVEHLHGAFLASLC